MKKTVILLIAYSFLISCITSPTEIDYGRDQCASCKMIIADDKFGCILITSKGRMYKYDAIECLVTDVQKNGEAHYKEFWVADYLRPGKLIDGLQASFAECRDIPSPMGGFLSAYESNNEALNYLKGSEKTLYSWPNLLLND